VTAPRQVRCTGCGKRWRAQPLGELNLVSTPEEGAVAQEPATIVSAKAPEPALAELPGEKLPKAYRARAEPSLQDGHAALTISGVLRNIENKAVSAPPLRLSLLNPAGKRVGGKVAAAAYPLVPPGETRHFAIAILDPPSTAKDLEIGFVLDPGAAKVVKAAVVDPHVSAHLSLRGVTDSITVPPAEAIAAKSLPLDPLTPGAPIDRHSPA